MAIAHSAKTIVCFGDSNTWGADPNTGGRYPRGIRWPSALQRRLGNSYEVISEGLCGRTLIAHDAAKPHRTGILSLPCILQTHDPIDLVILMLGTNDIKTAYRLSAQQIARHLAQAIRSIRDRKLELTCQPQIMIICPPSPVAPRSGPIDPCMSRWPQIFPALPELYQQVAQRHRCSYLNAGDYISSSAIDGFHLDPGAHRKLAEVIAARVTALEL